MVNIVLLPSLISISVAFVELSPAALLKITVCV